MNKSSVVFGSFLYRRMYNFDQQLTSAVDAILEILSPQKESTEDEI